MSNVLDVLEERGYLEQATHPEELRELLGKESVTFYIGFDPTADSLHVGHFVQIMVMMHMQRHGHRPIALLGGGTGMVGDPSGRSDMRNMLTPQQIKHNVESFRKQMSRFIDFDGGKALMVDNADWLTKLNYIDFLRDIGSQFSVNRMLSAECFKTRMATENGLSFLEFNYMLMQAYDFLELYRRHGCKIQFGGNDQWSNIIAGVDLVRRLDKGSAFGMTFKLLLKSDGTKMGKTAGGAVWLDPEKTSPYDFYQYWRNVDDPDVENCLSLLTFLPMEEVRRLGSLEGSEINKAKQILAYEVTKLVHGQEEAEKAQAAAQEVFGGSGVSQDMPTTKLAAAVLDKGIDAATVLVETGLCPSKGEARRLIAQKGVSLWDRPIESFDQLISSADMKEGAIILKKGKKTYHKIIVG
ncbi:MAG: tyrosine--tRNA ligase [Peptococcaceae bacterium]|nr:tyrosine--tRNA ligase [Peptococcaceae bacterium]